MTQHQSKIKNTIKISQSKTYYNTQEKHHFVPNPLPQSLFDPLPQPLSKLWLHNRTNCWTWGTPSYQSLMMGSKNFVGVWIAFSCALFGSPSFDAQSSPSPTLPLQIASTIPGSLSTGLSICLPNSWDTQFSNALSEEKPSNNMQSKTSPKELGGK